MGFHIVCSRLEDIKEDEPTKVELEQIFHLLVDCTKVSATPVNSSPLQIPTPIQPADRSVTQSVLNKSPTQQAYLCCSVSSP